MTAVRVVALLFAFLLALEDRTGVAVFILILAFGCK